MSKKWIQIKIGKKEFSPIMINDGCVACRPNTMPTLSCTLNIPQRIADVPISFIYREGDSPIGNAICCDRINLSREKGLINTISMILGGNRVNPVKIDIFFNENEDGLCIGFLAQRFTPTKYIVRDEYWNNKESKTTIPASNLSKGKPSKEVFINNYLLFGELLQITASHADMNIVSKWESVINSIDDSEMLLADFKKYTDNLGAWLKLLCSWGLKQDCCMQYPGILINSDAYSTDDNQSIELEQNYKVIVPCWTVWLDRNGERIEKIVSKGLVKRI